MIAALEIEVGRHKKRLDSVYAEVEDLKRDKLSLSIETERIVKYNKYLEYLGVQKQKEIDIKQSTINGLDSQIQNKTERRDVLEHDINLIETRVKVANENLATIEVKVADHNRVMEETRNHTEETHRLANVKHEEADKKLNRITNFIKELNG